MQRNAFKIALITFLSNLYFYSHIGTLYYQSRGLNLLETTSITSVIVATIFLAEVPTGVIADRIGRKGSVVAALALQTLGEVLFLFASTYAAFFGIAVLAGVGFAFASGATEALIYDSLKPDSQREEAMQKAMGTVGGAYHLAFFLGPLVGGLVVTQLMLNQYLRVIAMTAGSVFVALLVSLTLDEPAIDRSPERESPLAILRGGIDELRHSRTLRQILLLTVFTSTFHGVLVALYQPLFVAYDLPPLLIGVGLSAGGLLAAFALRQTYRLRQWFGMRRGLMIAAALPGLLYILLALESHPLAVFGVFVLAYGTVDLKKPLLSAFQNQHIAPQTRATTLSLINMFSSLYIAVMSLVFGALADKSLPLTFVVMGLMITGSALIFRTGDN